MNNAAFKQNIFPLVKRAYPMLVRMLSDEEKAKDALQDILVKLWQNRRKLEQHANIEGYVFLVARNHCLDKIRERKKLGVSIPVSENLPQDIDGNTFAKEELTKQIYKLIEMLPESQREVILLRDLDGLDYTEIETITGLKTSHLRVLLSRARKQIREQLQKIEQDEKTTVR